MLGLVRLLLPLQLLMVFLNLFIQFVLFTGTDGLWEGRKEEGE